MSADILLYTLTIKHIKHLFQNIGHSLLSETICCKTVLQSSTIELQQIRNDVDDKQNIQVVDESPSSGIHYLNILIVSLETPHVCYLRDCQPLSCAPTSNSIAQAKAQAILSDLLKLSKSLSVFYCLKLQNM